MEEQEVWKWIKFIQDMAWPYEIDEQNQPMFWKAVIIKCRNPNEDISGLILKDSKRNQEVVRFQDRRGLHYYGAKHFSHYAASSIEELITEISKEILLWHKMSVDDLKRIFLNVNKEGYLQLLEIAEKSFKEEQ